MNRRSFLGGLAAVRLAAQTSAMVSREIAKAPREMIRTAIGVTRKNSAIPALLVPGDGYENPNTRIMLVGGLDGSSSSIESVIESLRWLSADGRTRQLSISAVPVANPDGWAWGTGTGNGSGGDPTRGYPDSKDAEAAYLWRWIAVDAPDLVIDVRGGGPLGFHSPDPALVRELRGQKPLTERDELAVALARSVPAIQMRVGASWQTGLFKELIGAVRKAHIGPSPARLEMQRRVRRTPAEVAAQLAKVYGHDLDQPVYIPAVALIARMRLGEVEDVKRIAEPYASGAKPSLAKPTASHLSGHLVFAELARATGDARYVQLVRAAADLAFDTSIYTEMSDGMFMGCPILAQAGKLTGESKYFEQCLKQMHYMLGLVLRPDGLCRHSPLTDAAWGRGNAFVALGMALAASELPESVRAEMLKALRAHIAELVRYQDPTGPWHEVIDHPESYRELTATCMISSAMLRGMRMGWLDRAAYDPVVRRAWIAASARIAPNGDVADVCTGTGKQKTLRDYFDRPIIYGKDGRGGAMALLFATELMA